MTVTPLQDWLKDDSEEVKLPSGRVVRLRRPDLVDMLMGNGDIPDVLTNIIIEGINGGKKDIDLNKETFPQLMEALNVIAKATFVEPKLWDNPEADVEQGYLPISKVTFADKSFVFGWAMGAQFQPAETFPAQQNGHLATVPAGGEPGKKRR